MRHLRSGTEQPFPGDLPYGKNHAGSQSWADIDGRVYRSGNPVPLRIRRAVDRVRRAVR